MEDVRIVKVLVLFPWHLSTMTDENQEKLGTVDGLVENLTSALMRTKHEC
jgi:hypothetical protein